MPSLVCLPSDTSHCAPLESVGDGSRPNSLWPIVTRLPTYLKLAWALIKEPTIPARHKAPLGLVLAYEVSPPHLVIAAIPILGQVDSIVLFLLAIRHTMAHCPPKVALQHLSRLGLSSHQMHDDTRALKMAFRGLVGPNGHAIGRNARFAGRVMNGFARRRLTRMLTEPA